MPTDINEISNFASARLKMRDVLTSLQEHGGVISDDKGHATTYMMSYMDEKGRTESNSNSRINTVLGKLEQAGWIRRKINGKRTMSIALTAKVPDDVLLVPVEKPSSNGSAVVAPPEASPEAPPEEPIVVPPSREVEDFEDIEEQRDPSRSGRIAKRIEKTLPPLIRDNVRAEFGQLMVEFAASLGFVPVAQSIQHEELVVKAEHDAMVVASKELEARIAQLEDELRYERQQGHLAREELNKALAGTNAGQPATQGLSPHDVHESYRGLATWAIQCGWSIFRTRGGHLMWRGPQRHQLKYGGSTPGDSKSAMLLRDDLERMGLPKQRETTG